MKFDTVIIGGGLAGLTCGIALAKQKKRCAMISTGQSALHFSSGSFDLLNALPDGTPVSQPLTVHQTLQHTSPTHPYSRLSTDQFADYAELSAKFLAESGLSFHGHYTKNHSRLSPIGQFCPTWLTINDAPVVDDLNALPWKKIVLVEIQGFLDFQPKIVSDRLTELGVDVQMITAQLPELDRLRDNPSEFRSINLANIFDNQPLALEKLGHIIRPYAQECDAVFLPAVLGLFKPETLAKLTEFCHVPIHLVPTLPPSLLGMKIYNQLVKTYKKLGGEFIIGDVVTDSTIENQRVTAVFTRNHTDIPFIADHFILASGSFFSHGLVASRHEIFEPIFNLDTETPSDREAWSQRDFFAAQPYLQYGVKTDAHYRAIKNGRMIENLYAVGALLSGFDPIKQGCGAGVSLLTALRVADHICHEGNHL